MLAVEYFEVECPEPVGAEYYKQITNDVLLDQNLLKVIDKLHVYIDPKVPVFIAVGILKPITNVVKVGDIANINPQEGKMTLVITDETYLASMLKVFWGRFGKDRVEQPDRFTVILYNVKEEAKEIEELVIGHPAESLNKQTPDLCIPVRSAGRVPVTERAFREGKVLVCCQREYAGRGDR